MERGACGAGMGGYGPVGTRRALSAPRVGACVLCHKDSSKEQPRQEIEEKTLISVKCEGLSVK